MRKRVFAAVAVVLGTMTTMATPAEAVTNGQPDPVHTIQRNQTEIQGEGTEVVARGEAVLLDLRELGSRGNHERKAPRAPATSPVKCCAQ